MARYLTDYQWITLWEIDDHPAGVWRRGDLWFKRMGTRDIEITLQVKVLLQRGLIVLAPESSANVAEVTEAGRRALEARDYMLVIDRWNSRDS